ncbi:iron chelate uptake ABC transporter family permease subunit [uncultured Roseobacter sp.]|uniref:FecCD family ABC transporter permease n=1 Tax=uncultured Roseobacter sp. TaxID=114847 RepID=UPI00261D72D5|nr:iron chelate uptake ABC transporter family permease subunit [uncultured Roseobacter sp.]
MGVVVDRRQRARQLRGLLALGLIAVCVISLAVGASGTSLWRALWSLMVGQSLSATEAAILWEIRAPRTLLGACVGAALAVSGAVMQGLFRNPLADPGLLGVSAGAGLGALLAIVLGSALPFGIAGYLGDALLPVMAFAGAWASMMLLYVVATRSGRTSVATMLLAGIALAALTGAVSGLLIFHADDMQLRELTFWQLGSLAGSSWSKVMVAGPVIVIATCIATTLAHGLNGLALGEASAHHMGINVQRTKNVAILGVSAATGAAVAVSGGIGFVGIVVPHLLRLFTGPDHHGLLINSALLGASLLLLADIVSRFIVAPAELPIGIVTAVLGAPFFLWILLRRRTVVDL